MLEKSVTNISTNFHYCQQVVLMQKQVSLVLEQIYDIVS